MQKKKKKKSVEYLNVFFAKQKDTESMFNVAPPPKKKITDYIFLKLMSKIFTGEKERCVHPLNES